MISCGGVLGLGALKFRGIGVLPFLGFPEERHCLVLADSAVAKHTMARAGTLKSSADEVQPTNLEMRDEYQVGRKYSSGGAK